jgi:hypothetical protein
LNNQPAELPKVTDQTQERTMNLYHGSNLIGSAGEAASIQPFFQEPNPSSWLKRAASSAQTALFAQCLQWGICKFRKVVLPGLCPRHVCLGGHNITATTLPLATKIA